MLTTSLWLTFVFPLLEEAMTEAGITAEDLSMVVVASDTHEYISPPTSVVVQGRLGADQRDDL